jgi:Protein of unknown function (DUF4199)
LGNFSLLIISEARAGVNLKLFRVFLPAGLLGGLACGAFQGILYLAGLNPLGEDRYLDFWIAPLTIVFAFWWVKNQRPGGEFRLSEGVMGGGFLNFILALTSAACLWLFIAVLDRGLLPQYVALMQAKLRALPTEGMKVPERQMLAAQIKGLPSTTAGGIFIDEFLKKVFWGMVSVPIISIAMRRRLAAAAPTPAA